MLEALPVLGLLYRLTDELGDGKAGLMLGAFSGILTGYLISVAYPLALMLGGLTVGLLVANRIRSIAHRVGLGAAILTVLYLGNPIVPPLPLVGLAVASLSDNLLSELREPFSIFADINIVLNAVLVGYAVVGVLNLESIAALIAAELAYMVGGFVIGSQKGKRHSAGA